MRCAQNIWCFAVVGCLGLIGGCEGGSIGGAYIESRRQAEDLVLGYAGDRGLPAVAMCVSNPCDFSDGWMPPAYSHAAWA
jgi:hypothetical protein